MVDLLEEIDKFKALLIKRKYRPVDFIKALDDYREMVVFEQSKEKCQCGHSRSAHTKDGSCFFAYNCDCKGFTKTED